MLREDATGTLSSSHRLRTGIHVRNPKEEKMAFADVDRDRVERDPPTISSEEHPVDDESAINQRLSKSLMRLDFKDRNLIGEEIHGVVSLAPDETPHLINDSLQRMNEELNAIVSSSRIDKQAFQAARLLPKTYVNDRHFRLKFLRCELFDPIKAADRMIVYLDYLLLLFGRRVLEEPLNLSFFADEEAAALREGHIQLLPFRDRRGRRVMTVLPKALSYTPTLRVKIWFYFHHVCSEDVETQRSGIIGLAWGGSDDEFDKGKQTKLPGSYGHYKRIVTPSGRAMDECYPIRVVALHMCYPDSAFYRLIRSFYILIMPVEYLPRVLFHCGTKMEMRYKLMSYGIPVTQIPDTDRGAVKLKNHIQWLKIRKLIENDPIARASLCECPGVNDVLFRRAGSCLAHPGNSQFKDLIESKKAEHESSNQTEKRDISWSIVEEVESRSGRFFKWSTNQTCWIQIKDRSEIRLKVAMSIRDFNRQSKATKNLQSTKSSTNAFQEEHIIKKRKKNECNTCAFPRLPRHPK